MRTASAHLTTMLAGNEHTRARCLWLVLRDGSTIGLTDHDRQLRIDMPFYSDVPQVFRPDIGMLPSDIVTGVGLEADSFEIEGPVGGVFARTLLLGRRFNRALAWLFDVDWNQQGGYDILPLAKGVAADVSIKGPRFVLEIRSDVERFNQVIGGIITAECHWEFGDPLTCRAVVPQASAEVTAVTDDFRFVLDLAGVYADDHFIYGNIQFTSGDLVGVDPVEIFDYTGSTSAVELLVPLPEAPSVGDQVVISRGCSKLKSSDNAALPTCVGYDNVINFGGFDRVPGTDQYLKIAVPGELG